MELANCQTNLGLLASETNKLGDANQRLDAAVTQLRGLVKQHPQAVTVRQALASALVNRGEFLAETGEREAAVRILRECLAVLTGLPDASAAELLRESAQPSAAGAMQPERTRRLLDQAIRAHDVLGRVLLDQGRYEAAATEMNVALRLSTKLTDLEPDNPRYRESRAAAQIYLAPVLRVLGRVDEEAHAYQQAIRDYTALCTAMPGVPDFEQSWALTRMDLGNLLYHRLCRPGARRSLAGSGLRGRAS